MSSLNSANVQDITALTSMQEELLFLYLQNPDSEVYFEQLSLRLVGEIDITRIGEIWNNIADSNEMLRTVILWENLEKPIQAILRKKLIPINEYDITDEENVERQKLIQNFLENDRKVRIDISKNPIRISILRLDKDSIEMVISYHHILFDGWSTGILLKEFVEQYEGKYNEIPKSKFKEYLKWYQRRDKEKARKFWTSFFEGFDTVTPLPSFTANRNKRVKESNTYSKVLDSKLVQKITNFSKDQHVTVATQLYSAWGILLQKYSNLDDIIFGTTVSIRPPEIRGIENTVGLFINTVPLRIKSETDMKIRDIVTNVEKFLIERNEYEETSLTDIKAYSGLNQEEGLFRSIMVIENYPIDQILKNSSEQIHINLSLVFERTNFNITIFVTAIDGINIKFVYDSNAFEPFVIKGIAQHLENILLCIVENSEIKLSELDIITDIEKKRLLCDFNDTKTPYRSDKTISQLFEEQAAKNFNNIALVFKNRNVTYKDLNEKANMLAVALRDKGVCPGTIVAIVLRHTIEMIVAILGILKAGGGYLPIDPNYPSDRIKYMLDDSKVQLILAQKGLLEDLRIDRDYIDLLDEESYKGDGHNLTYNNKVDDLAYIIYTSGSTGVPKAVMIEHKSVVNFFTGIKKHIDFSEKKTILALTTVSFDIFVLETLLPLSSGLKVVLADEEQQIDSEALSKIVFNNKVDIIQATPSKIQLLLNNEKFSRALNSCSEIVVGGEIFPQALLEKLKEYSKLRIYNVYGPTETTVWSTLKDLTFENEINIGKPIANTQIYIVDSYQKLSPIGISGELCIGGEGVARGYLNPNEKFVQNPFGDIGKMYMTGDIARWLPDGNIEILGRKDSQVKIRGYRIELGEIENILLEYKPIKKVVVIDQDNVNNEKILYAYLVTDREVTVSEIREYLLSKLPDYMIPAYFIRVEKIPLTPNGKVDRKALLSENGAIETGVSFVAPSNNVEKELVEIWKGLLNIEKVGVNDDFFSLGGNSIILTKLSMVISKRFNDCVKVQDLFDFRTIKGLAEIIISKSNSEHEDKNQSLKIIKF